MTDSTDNQNNGENQPAYPQMPQMPPGAVPTPPMPPVQPQYLGPQNPRKKFEPFGITSISISPVALLFSCCCLPISFLVGVIGIVFGILSLTKFRKEPQVWDGQYLAIIGLVMNGLAVIISLALFFLPLLGLLVLPSLTDY